MDTTHEVSIQGMTCGGCSGRVTNVLLNTPGVKSATISHEQNNGVIVTDSTLSTSQLLEIIEATGFSASV